jgi:GTP-binding protein
MADIPGIIEGAHEGKGLGLRFLRHIERNAVLLFMLPCDTDDLIKTYETLEGELRAYNPELLDKPRVVAITKCDLIDQELQKLISKELPKSWNSVFVSAIVQTGLTELKDALWAALQSNHQNLG